MGFQKNRTPTSLVCLRRFRSRGSPNKRGAPRSQSRHELSTHLEIDARLTAKLAAFQIAGGSMNSDTSHPNALSLSVPITRSLERLLTRAAMDRSQSAQELAKRIICDWLLKEGGVSLGGGPARKVVAGRQEP